MFGWYPVETMEFGQDRRRTITTLLMEKIVPLSDQTTEIIYGSLLGDGSLQLHKGYANARFSFRHSEQQAAYFYWKVEMLKEISSTSSVFVQKADGYSHRPKLRYQSRALPALTALHNITSKHNQLRIRRTWLNNMSALSLAVWWFDDGSLIANSRKGVFCTDGFDKESVKILAKYLEIVWNIRTHVAPVKRPRHGTQNEYWRLWIRSTDEMKKFLRIILPHTCVEELLPKVLLLYSDSKFQQRWISEVQTLTDFSLETIEKYVSAKKSRWKQFRE